MIPHRDDPSPPSPGPPEREAVRRRANAIRRRRALTVTVPCAAVALVALGVTMALYDSEPRTTVAAGGDPQQEPTGVPASSTSTSTTTTMPVSSSSSITGPSRRTISLSRPLPSGWLELTDPGYPLLEGRAALTISTVDDPVEPFPTCDYPLGPMAALGPSDALVSIVETPEEHSQDPRPPSSEFLPPRVPLNTPEICPEAAGEPPLELRFSSLGFVEGDKRFRLNVAIAPAAGQDIAVEVQRIIDSIVIS